MITFKKEKDMIKAVEYLTVDKFDVNKSLFGVIFTSSPEKGCEALKSAGLTVYDIDHSDGMVYTACLDPQEIFNACV